MIETAIKAAKLAGEKLEYYFETLLEIEEKEDTSLVTKADKEADQIIIDLIKKEFPEHQILTEENGSIGGKGEYLWVIDPLDGTLNFTRGIPFFSTSIALLRNNQPILAVVYNPITNSIFSAEAGKGAFWNGEKIGVSGVSELKDSIVSMGRAKDQESKDKTLEIYNKFYFKLKSQRILSGAALELAYVASGRLEGYVSIGLKPWDFLGGALLVKEAGGKITAFSGKDWHTEETHFLASNGKVHEDLLEIISA